MNDPRVDMNSRRILIPGVDFLIPVPRPITQSGIECCFRWSSSSVNHRDPEGARVTQSEGLSATIYLGFGSHLPKRKPFSTLRGNSGWLRVQQLDVAPTTEACYLLSSAFDDDEKPVAFDVLEMFFDEVEKVELAADWPLAIEHRFTSELARHLQYSLADWHGKRRESGLELAKRLADERESIQKRLAELKAALLEEESPNHSWQQPSVSDSETNATPQREVNVLRSEQSYLRECLLAVEAKETEAQRLESDVAKLSQALTVKTLFTLKWFVNARELPKVEESPSPEEVVNKNYETLFAHLLTGKKKKHSKRSR